MDIEHNHVIVTVNSSGTPVCTPDTVQATGRNCILTFHLRTDGYVFPDSDAVVVTDGGTEFPTPSTTPLPTKVHLFNRNSRRALFKYTVTVKEVSSGRLIPLDPSIQNED